jgi:glucokinase
LFARYTCDMSTLLVDLGGSYTRCAITVPQGPLEHIQAFANDDFANPVALLAGYIAALPSGIRPRSALIAVAAPVLEDRVQMINRSWEFSQQELRTQLRLDALSVMNDFAAQAWAVADLRSDESINIGNGSSEPGSLCAVLGPGTGLGVAALFRAEGHWHVLPGEGGHVSLPAQSIAEEHVIRSARERFGHCSAERILSGPGLSFLHGVLHGETGLAPAAIGAAALAGSPSARTTFAVFFGFLGTVAADLALTLGAFGGVFITGGIVPRYLDLMRSSEFRQRFEAKGRYSGYLARIATRVLTTEMPALHGLRKLAASERDSA